MGTLPILPSENVFEMRKFYYLFTLVLLIQACGPSANEEHTSSLPSCECPILNDFIRTSSELSEIKGNTNKSDALQGTNFIAEVSYDSTSKGVKIMVPVPKKGQKSFEEYYYDGSQIAFTKSIFLVRWCDIWSQYVEVINCRIPGSEMEQYNEKRKELFLEYDGVISPKKRKEPAQDKVESVEKNPSGESKGVAIKAKKSCRDTLIKPSSFDMNSFEYVKLNGITVPPVSDEKVTFCYEKGDLLEVKSKTQKVVRITL